MIKTVLRASVLAVMSAGSALAVWVPSTSLANSPSFQSFMGAVFHGLRGLVLAYATVMTVIGLIRFFDKDEIHNEHK